MQHPSWLSKVLQSGFELTHLPFFPKYALVAHLSQDKPLHLAQSGSFAQYLFGVLDWGLTDLEGDLTADLCLTGDLCLTTLTGDLCLTGDGDLLTGVVCLAGRTGLVTLTGVLDLIGDDDLLTGDLLLTGDDLLADELFLAFLLLCAWVHDDSVYCLVFDANERNPSEAKSNANFIFDLLINNYKIG